MPKSDPDRFYRRGLAALSAGKPDVAVLCFRRSIEIERESGVLRPHMRYLSYYGLSMALAHRPTKDAVQLCEQAASRDTFDPLLLCNLGRVYLLAGKTTRALATFERGLRLDPGNAELRRALATADRRAKPALAALGRNHPLNRSLGRLRVSLFGHRARQTA